MKTARVGLGGGVLQIKIKPVLTEQPCVSECACTSVSKHIHVFGYVHSCVVTCLSPPHLLQPHAPPPYPQGYCPTPDPALPGPSGPVAKKKKKDVKGNRFLPPWGAVSVDLSAKLKALSSGLWCPAGSLQPPRGRRALKWALRLQTPETRLCMVAVGGHWWLTPSLCLWTCHAREAELQRKTCKDNRRQPCCVRKFAVVRDKTEKERQPYRAWFHIRYLRLYQLLLLPHYNLCSRLCCLCECMKEGIY